MLPFTRQIQIATDGAKGCVARLAGLEVPKWDDNEASLDDLRARAAQDHRLRAVDSRSADRRQRGTRDLLPTRSGDPLRFTGEAYLKHYVLPNLYFHTSMTYALLRHAGVDLGKKDFLG
jgi:hypothetical protein